MIPEKAKVNKYKTKKRARVNRTNKKLLMNKFQRQRSIYFI